MEQNESPTEGMLKSAWAELNFWERASLLMTVPPLAVLMAVKAATKLARRTPEVLQVTEDVWQMPYYMPHGCMSTILRSREDGTLLLHSPPPAAEDVVPAIAALGRVDAILVPSPVHDTHCAAWKALFPNAKVITHDRAADHVSKSVQVDHTYSSSEGRALLRRYQVVEFFDVTPYQRFPDAHLKVHTPRTGDAQDHTIVAACGFMGYSGPLYSPAVLWQCLAGMGPARYTRHGSLLFLKDPRGLLKHWEQEVMQSPGVRRVVFQHGTGMPHARAQQWMVSRDFLSFTFT